MENYVTLFDSLYLPQGISLHRSMQRHVKSFTLWIICMDKNTYFILGELDLPNVKLLFIDDLETNELLAVKSDRSKGEYCWTLTPFAPKFVFNQDISIDRVTYIDADLWFRKDPEEIFLELDTSGKGVLITDHNYAPMYDQSATSGQYCVQFMTFKRNDGELVRSWWEERCLEWCYARFEDGKFGDQKYLDDWTSRFNKQVHVLKNKELMLAPWNAVRFPYGNSIIWHFQGLNIIRKKSSFYAYFGFYNLPTTTRDFIYQEYLKDLGYSIEALNSLNHSVRTQGVMTIWQKTRELILQFLVLLKFPLNLNLVKINVSQKEAKTNL